MSKTFSFNVTRRLLAGFAFAGIAACVLLFVPAVQDVIIAFAERFVVRRPLRDHAKWAERLVDMGLGSTALFVCVFLLTLFGKKIVFIWIPLLAVFLRKILKSMALSCERSPVVRYAVLSLPALFGFLVIDLYGVDVLFWDEWSIPRFVNRVLSGDAHFSDFFAQHNEHRIFFPRIVFLGLSLVTHMNSKAFMFFSWLLNLVIYGLLVHYIQHSMTSSQENRRSKEIPLSLALGFCCFSVVQYENILWGFQVGFFMVAFSVVCTLYAFHKACTENKPRYTAAVCIFGIIASFSSIHGILVWPVIFGAMLLLYLSKSKVSILRLLILFVTTVLICAAYFYGYHRPGHHPDYFGASLWRVLEYCFVSIGAPLCLLFPSLGNARTAIALLCGLFLVCSGLALTIYLIARQRVSAHIFPLCLLYFGYAFCGAITMGRAGFGVGQAFSSRYTTFSLYIVAGISLIVYPEFIMNNKLPRFLRRASCLLLSVIVGMAVIQNLTFREVTNWRNVRLAQTAVLSDYENQPLEKLNQSCPWKDLEAARQEIEWIKSRRWSLFWRDTPERSAK